MPLVQLFRLLMLFLNVYETFKILKSPPPSIRRGGPPSVRAVTQRKRDMKGCLAVWIVWCCFATHERTFDVIISRLVPFYDEFKSLILVFLIVTRAKGAEPIFLHILRPIIKPYASTVDSLLDLTRMVGDLLFLLAAVPLRLASSWWHSLVLCNDEETDHRSCTDDTDADSLRDLTTPDFLSYPPLPPLEPQPSARRVPNKNQTYTRRSVDSRHPSVNIAQGNVRTRRQVLEAGPKQEDGQSRVSKHNCDTSQHQIWHPPQSSYQPTEVDQEPRLVQTRVSLPPNVPALELLVESDTTSEEPVDEWRRYPPFPSAYPPTPLPPTSQLSLPHSPINSSVLELSPHRTFDNIQFPSLPTIPDNVQRQDFVRSFLPPRKPLSPGFLDGSSSDHSSTSMVGIQDQGQNTDVRSDGAVLGVSDMDDEEHDETDDEFDVTLRTPHPTIRASRPNTRSKASSLASTVASSVPSRSTALTTVDEGSSLRTRTSSESSLSISVSDSSSIASSSARQKRTLPCEHSHIARHGTNAFESSTLEASTIAKRPGARVPSRVVTRSQQQVVRGLAGSIGDDDSDEDSHSGGACVDRIAPDQKRRRMLGPSREPSVYSTRTKVTSQERSAMQRAGSSRSALSSDGPPIASRASSRVSRRATDPTTNASHTGPVPPRRASDKNPTRRR